MDSYTKRWAAEDAAHRVRGVKAVAKDIEVRLPDTERTDADIADEARPHALVVKDRCIIKDHRHLFTTDGEVRAGHSRKTGVHVRRRKPTFEDNRPRQDDECYVAGGDVDDRPVAVCGRAR